MPFRTIVVLDFYDVNQVFTLPSPVADKYLNRVASGFGTRFHPILKVNKVHNGLDFAASTGTPIYATGDGKVKMAGFNSGYGNVVVINHGNGYKIYRLLRNL